MCINTIICSLLYKAAPDEVKLILVDPKVVVELTNYNGIPHLLTPVVTGPKQAASALHWAVVEMERRYSLFAKTQVRKIDDYNAQVQPGEKLPFIVVIIDELSDLMMVAAVDVEDAILRLAQKARAAGIHLILATQRPSVDVLTGTIKANIPSGSPLPYPARSTAGPSWMPAGRKSSWAGGICCSSTGPTSPSGSRAPTLRMMS